MVPEIKFVQPLKIFAYVVAAKKTRRKWKEINVLFCAHCRVRIIPYRSITPFDEYMHT